MTTAFKNLVIEYKRRFLVSKIPASVNLDSYEKQEKILGYLSKPADSLEIECECLEGDIFKLNTRDVGTRKRNNIILNISNDDANLIMSVSNPKILNLIQYKISDNIFLFKYTNLNNIMIVEYISDNLADLNKFEPYFWFKNEITDNYNYSNLNLSINKHL
jgi:CYTH domain-containing protein